MEVPKDIDPQAKVYIEHLAEMNKQLNDQLDKLKQEYSNSMNLLPDLQKAYQEINELKSKMMIYSRDQTFLYKQIKISGIQKHKVQILQIQLNMSVKLQN